MEITGAVNANRGSSPKAESEAEKIRLLLKANKLDGLDELPPGKKSAKL
jgi:hypothetical protein